MAADYCSTAAGFSNCCRSRSYSDAVRTSDCIPDREKSHRRRRSHRRKSRPSIWEGDFLLAGAKEKTASTFDRRLSLYPILISLFPWSSY